MTTDLVLLSRVAFRGREISGARLQGLLALLADDLRTGCSTARLVDRLWPDAQPEHPTKALQVLVSRARAQLGSDVVAATRTGYRLALADDQVDAAAVLSSEAASIRHARAGDHAAALADAEAGLALWNGHVDDDAPDDPVSALRAERAATHRSLVRSRALALARLGRHAEAVDRLTEIWRERPRDEEVLLALLRSESATLGPAAALARYETYRRGLRDDLGTDPGPALRALHQELLRGRTPVAGSGGTPGTVRRGVAHEPNPLLGRDGDVAAVRDLLAASRVVSVVGPGGLGKTRLAHTVGHQAPQRVVAFVPLAGVATDDDVMREVTAIVAGDARPAPMPHLGSPDPVAAIATALGPGPALLVLDNCEHVIDGAADLVHALVSRTRDVRVLVTSRAPLGLSSESVYALPELDLAAATELFVQRARAARPGADLPMAAVTDLCRHLDGLPLAVELAAARVRAMSVTEITRRLADRFALLRGGARDAPQRHRTLHAALDWSWNLLDPAGQRAMRALSLLSGGFTEESARYLLDDGDVLPVLENLIDQSLLKVTESATGTRFSMLETVREFASAAMDSAGETDLFTGRFLAWARDFGMAHHDRLLGADPMPAADLIRAEQDNLVQALRHAVAVRDGGTVAATTAALGGLWTIDAAYERLIALCRETSWVLSHFRPPPALLDVTRAAVVLSAAHSLMLGGHPPARPLVTLRRLPPAPPGTLTGAIMRTLIAVTGPRAPDLAALDALCDDDDELVAGVANTVMGYLVESTSGPDAALKPARRALEAVRDVPIPLARLMVHGRLGELCLQTELADEGRQHAAAAVQVLEDAGPWPDTIGVRWAMVLACLQAGAVEEAERWTAAAERQTANNPYWTLSMNLVVRAEIAILRGEIEPALELWRRALDEVDAGPDPVFLHEPTGLDPWVLELRSACVVAHARYGRIDAVPELVMHVTDDALAMVTSPADDTPMSIMELPVCGALLLALGMADLDRGRRRGDERRIRLGVRLVALADRCHFIRTVHPTMSSARAREDARNADGSAYADAVSAYADLDRDQLRTAAHELLRERDRGGP